MLLWSPQQQARRGTRHGKKPLITAIVLGSTALSVPRRHHHLLRRCGRRTPDSAAGGCNCLGDRPGGHRLHSQLFHRATVALPADPPPTPATSAW
ncbi:hypothetical protein DSL92_01565 [Billgrantia gudaonensis]|uniref:Uncharacterized protein n=1 Tax=Billgrantia gudaonensis TaxID=376427 RepID=A0A432JLY5_9GAMM|nr:hypothetical protein DSL92_01565 [Halomonas gudaonensis]